MNHRTSFPQAFLIALCVASLTHAATIFQDPANDYVAFPAGDYRELTNDGLSLIEDNGDGTLTTVAREDQTSVVTYEIQFANEGDYFLYFRFPFLNSTTLASGAFGKMIFSTKCRIDFFEEKVTLIQ